MSLGVGYDVKQLTYSFKSRKSANKKKVVTSKEQDIPVVNKKYNINIVLFL